MLTDFVNSVFNSDLMAGGWVIVVILLLSSVMWILILDRYYYLLRSVEPYRVKLIERWRKQHGIDPLISRRLRLGLTNTFHDKLSSTLPTIQVITAILPLLGLLGTVTGMIKTFEVMTLFGTGNVRGMAEGISQALITTMAGLFTALSGMYFASNLHERIENETAKLAEALCLDDEDTMKGGNSLPRGDSP